jgi:PEP-CTERM motif
MLRKLSILCLLAVLPVVANAAATSSIGTTNCVGDFSVSLLGDATFSCSGSLTMTGGTVTSDSLISIVSNGDLFLDNLSFTAPNISFSVLSGLMTIGSGVVFNGSSVTLASNGGPVNGRTFPLGGSISSDPNAGSIVLGAGRTTNLGAGSGYVFTPSTNLPAAGGTLVLGSGSGGLIINAVVDPFPPAIVLAAVPEPSTYALMFAGILGLLSIRRKSI